MSRYSHLADRALLLKLDERAAQDCNLTADLLALIAEVDRRKLYLGEGYSSMFEYCRDRLRFSEDIACKRIRAARAVRRFPGLLDEVASGRVHLSGLSLLVSHLTTANADEIVRAATHKSKREIEQLIAERFPSPDVPTKIRAVTPTLSQPVALPPMIEAPALATASEPAKVVPAPGPVEFLPVQTPVPPARVTPLAPKRFALQLTMDQETHDLLREAQELLSHQVASNDVAGVLRRVLEIALPKLRNQKFGATSTPREARDPSSSHARYIPAAVKRAVERRDHGQCTFVGEAGHRCESRTLLEYDHIVPFARGGQTSVANLRLRCRAHNAYEAERLFGEEFIRQKRA